MNSNRLQSIIIFPILVALVYGLLAQGAFYKSDFQVIQLLILLCVIFWIGSSIQKKKLTFNHTDLDSKILLLILVLGITTYTSINIKKSINEIQHYLVYFLIYWLIINNIRKKDLINLTCAVLISAGAALAIAGLVGLIFRVESLVMQTQGVWRISSTLTYPNALAGYFILILPITYHFSSHSQPRWQQLVFGIAFYFILLSLILTSSRSGWLLAILIIFTILLLNHKTKGDIRNIRRLLLFLISSLATVPFYVGVGSRNYFLPLLAMTCVCAILVYFIHADQSSKHKTTQKKMPKLMARGLVVLLLLVGVTFVAISYRSIFTKTLVDRIISVIGYQERLISWKGALQIIKKYPITGVGLGNFSQALQQLNYPYSIEFVHNEYLQTFAETGIIGLAAFLFFLYGVFKQSFLIITRQKEVESKQIAIYLVLGMIGFCMQSFFDFLWHIPVLFMTFFTLTGLIGIVNQTTSSK